MGDVETEPAALADGFGGEERVEDLRQDFRIPAPSSMTRTTT